VLRHADIRGLREYDAYLLPLTVATFGRPSLASAAQTRKHAALPSARNVGPSDGWTVLRVYAVLRAAAGKPEDLATLSVALLRRRSASLPSVRRLRLPPGAEQVEEESSSTRSTRLLRLHRTEDLRRNRCSAR